MAAVTLGKYGKALVAALGVASLVLADNVFDVSDGVEIVLAVLTALGVWGVKNVPSE